MDDSQYFGQKTYWSTKWYNLMVVKSVILLFYSVILPIQYTAYIVMFFVVSWLFYVIKYLELREKKKKEKKDGLEITDK